MAATKHVKVLSLGSFNGFVKESLDKIKILDGKHGPFAVVLTVGDFFGDLKADDAVVKELLAGKIVVPCPIYFIGGEKPLPETVRETAEKNDGEICPNLTFLGQQGLITTSEGLRIAFLSGVYDGNSSTETAESGLKPVTDGGLVERSIRNFYRSADITALSESAKERASPTSLPGIDILLTYEWPKGIAQSSAVAENALTSLNLPPQTRNSGGVQSVADVAAILQPRYHYASTFRTENNEDHSVFFEREPYRNQGAAGKISGNQIASHVTRFLGLGGQGTTVKSRWLHAMSLIPLVHATPEVLNNIPPNTTNCPLAFSFTSRGVKRPPLDENYFYQSRPTNRQRVGARGPPPEHYTCNICKVKGHWIQECPQSNQNLGSNLNDRREGSNGHHRGQATAPESACWFCLSNPEVSKHLIACIGSELYIALAKGPLTDPTLSPGNSGIVPGGGHVLIVPINHLASPGAVPEESKDDFNNELAKFKTALGDVYAKNGAKRVMWEFCRSGPRQLHHHMQVVPVPDDLVAKVRTTFTTEGKIAGISFKDGEPSSLEFLRVEMPDGSVFSYDIPPRTRFNAQFGREVMARVLEVPDRANWKACARTEEEEATDTSAFKAEFAPFDFTLE